MNEKFYFYQKLWYFKDLFNSSPDRKQLLDKGYFILHSSPFKTSPLERVFRRVSFGTNCTSRILQFCRIPEGGGKMERKGKEGLRVVSGRGTKIIILWERKQARSHLFVSAWIKFSSKRKKQSLVTAASFLFHSLIAGITRSVSLVVSCIEFDDSPPMLEKERKKTEGLGKLRPSFLPLRFRPSAFPFPFHPSFLLSFTGQEYLNTMPPRRDRHCLFATTLWKRLRLTVEYL